MSFQKKFISLFVSLVLAVSLSLVPVFTPFSEATTNTVYLSKTTLTGGGATALDYIDGNLLYDGDIAHVFVSGTLYVYKLNATSGASPSSPSIIAPVTNAGTKRWILQNPYLTNATGIVKQVVQTTYATYANTTNVIPLDDTIPQNTEGTEIMTQAITPYSATNVLLIEVSVCGSFSAGATGGIAGLFQDSTANALRAITFGYASAPLTCYSLPTYKMAAGTTSATTFKVRTGPGVGGTMYLNGNSSARLLGGTVACSITITEISQ